MAQPQVKWLQVQYDETDATETTIYNVVEPMTVAAAYAAGKLGNTTAASEFATSYGPRPIWDAGIVEAGKYSKPIIGEFLLCNNLEKSAGGGPDDPVASMINVTLNVTDRKGESTDPSICGETENVRQATVKCRIFQKSGPTTYEWGVYNRDNSNTWAALNTEGTGAGAAMDESALPLELTYSKSQIINAVANSTPIASTGGTISGTPANWTGDAYSPGDNDHFPIAKFKQKNWGEISTDLENFARIQLIIKAKPSAEAGTVLFIVRANYQYQ